MKPRSPKSIHKIANWLLARRVKKTGVALKPQSRRNSRTLTITEGQYIRILEKRFSTSAPSQPGTIGFVRTVIQPRDNLVALENQLEEEKQKIEHKINPNNKIKPLRKGSPHGFHAQTKNGDRYSIRISFNQNKEATYAITPIGNAPKVSPDLAADIVDKVQKRINEWTPKHKEFFKKHGYKI